MEGNKICIVERILMLLLVITADVADFLGTSSLAIPFLGEAISLGTTILGFIISAIIIFWLIMKGVGIRWFLGGSGIELIPVINAIPARTAAVLMTFFEDSFSEAVKKFEKIK